MSDTHAVHEEVHNHDTVERIETINGSTPWGVRLGFGIAGFLLLAGAIIESVTVEIWLALIVGAFAVAITFLIVGRVQTYPSAGQSVFVVDRFSGEVELCTAQGCNVLPRNGTFLTTPPLPQLPALPHAK
jgi:hypothetical protein